MRISSIGIDLGKTTFHLIALDDHSKIVIKKKFSHKQMLAYTAKLQPALVGIEACSGAHFISRKLRLQDGLSATRARSPLRGNVALRSAVRGPTSSKPAWCQGLTTRRQFLQGPAN
jgi:transposase